MVNVRVKEEDKAVVRLRGPTLYLTTCYRMAVR